MAVVYVHANRLHEPNTSRFTVVQPDGATVLSELDAHGIKAQIADDGYTIDSYVSEGQTVAELLDVIKSIFARKAANPTSSEPFSIGRLLERYASSGRSEEDHED